MGAVEANFDGIVGPTHNYSGLSPGNLASQKFAGSASSPKAAALQGLAKAKRLADDGLAQYVLPPHERPNLAFLRQHGFTGSDARVIEKAATEAPGLLSCACSASAMWAANAATVSPSADTGDSRVHLTPANLAFNPHRCQEPAQTERTLRRIFADVTHFAVHPALAMTPIMFDEGAANHTRLSAGGPEGHSRPGVELFVHGRDGHDRRTGLPEPKALPARHSFDASAAVARLHRLSERETVFARQHPDVIDAGVFHNDVISVGNQNVLLVHERAYLDQAAVLDDLRTKLRGECGEELFVIEVADSEVSVADAVGTYLFNSQLLTLPEAGGGSPGGGGMRLFCPHECSEHAGVRAVIDRIIAGDNPITESAFIDVRESMHNGGGPACLRLRVVLTDEERAALSGQVELDDSLYGQLVGWVERNYRDELRPSDLADPDLLEESRAALDELTGLLGLGALYPFQRD
ncbi:MAG: succinylarginine dihydrolase [Phycisphaerales bacterium]|jgi:succinylarginine dihydrolase